VHNRVPPGTGSGALACTGVRSIAVRTEYRVAEASDVGSFETFYRAQADRVYRSLAVALADPQLAREAADEAMTRAYARWHRVRGLDNPDGWVFRVGLNWATSRWRKLRRERPIPESAADPGPSRAGVIAAQAPPCGPNSPTPRQVRFAHEHRSRRSRPRRAGRRGPRSR